MNRRAALSAWAVSIALLLVGCSAGPDVADPEERLAAAQAKVEAAEAITIDLTSTDVPSDVDGVRSATGVGVIEADLIKFEGEIQGRVGGVPASVSILAIGDETYVKLFTPEYERVDLSTLGVPNPTAFFATDTGVANLLATTTNVATGEEVREGSEVLTEIVGELSGEQVQALLHLGEAGQVFEVKYGLTDQDELRKAVLTGEFWPDTESSYSMLLTDYGNVVPIEAPTS